MLEIAPFSITDAIGFCVENGQEPVAPDGKQSFAIAIEQGTKIKGVIIMNATGTTCALHHLYTDATSQVGTLLYGAAWRAAKALGYKQITL